MNADQEQGAQEQNATVELVKMMRAKDFEIRLWVEGTMVIASLVRDEKVYCTAESVTIGDALLALYEVTQKW